MAGAGGVGRSRLGSGGVESAVWSGELLFYHRRGTLRVVFEFEVVILAVSDLVVGSLIWN